MILNKKFKFIAWGHSIEHGSTHTHSYIHKSYKDAFCHLGYEAYCKPDIFDPNFDYSNTIFLTEWQEAYNLPIRDDCFYILHNCDAEKFQDLIKNKQAIKLAVYTDDVLKTNALEKDKCIFYMNDERILFMPWATNLLPHEIETNKPTKVFNNTSNVINWVGTVGAGDGGNINELSPFIKACEENNIKFNHGMMIPDDKAIQMIKSSYMAPTISGNWQKNVANYIACRIFKNISYGQYGITNNFRINYLFNNKLIYNPDEYQLFYDAKEKLPKITLSELHDLMDEVKNKHTFLNRIDTIMDFISQVNPELIGKMIV